MTETNSETIWILRNELSSLDAEVRILCVRLYETKGGGKQATNFNFPSETKIKKLRNLLFRHFFSP